MPGVAVAWQDPGDVCRGGNSLLDSSEQLLFEVAKFACVAGMFRSLYA